MIEFKHTVHEFIAKEKLIAKGERVLVAVSGGPDSVALAHLLMIMGYEVGIAHCNFQLREEAEEEELFVKQLAENWNIPFYGIRFDTSKEAEATGKSIQTVARALRYSWLEELMFKEKFDKCAMGHHLGDQAENILLNLIRSKSPKILRGIPVTRGKFVRPFLGVTKTRIFEYLEHHQILFKTDSSNLEDYYLRNFIRNRIVPPALELNPSLFHQLDERRAHYELQFSFIGAMIRKEENAFIIRDADKMIVKMHEFSTRFGEKYLPILIDYCLADPAGEKNQVPGALYAEVVKLIQSLPGKFVLFPGGKIIRERDHLSILFSDLGRYDNQVLVNEKFQDQLEIVIGNRNVRMNFCSPEGEDIFKGTKDVYYLDAGKVIWPLKIRHWRAGDKMKPFGMDGHQKLSNIFIDNKFSTWQKNQAIVFEDSKQIICLSEFRIADEVRVKQGTDTVLKITIR